MIKLNINLRNTKFDLNNIIKHIQNKNLIQIENENNKNIINNFFSDENKKISINNNNFNNFNGAIKLNLENYSDLNN